jgi:hypothetical protein
MRGAGIAMLLAAVVLAPGAASAIPILHAAASGFPSFLGAPQVSDCVSIPVAVVPAGFAGPLAAQGQTCGSAHGFTAATAVTQAGHLGVASVAVSLDGDSFAGSGGHADYFDNVVFTAPGLPAGSVVPMSLNLNFGGVLNSSAGADATAQAVVVITGNAGQLFLVVQSGGVLIRCDDPFIGPSLCNNVIAPGTISTNTVFVTLGVPVGISLQLDVQTHSIGLNSANANYANSLDFPTGIDLFNLPAGVTANAPDSFIFNNRYVPPVNAAAAVPEPSSMLLVSSALGLFAMSRRRRTAKESKTLRELRPYPLGRATLG